MDKLAAEIDTVYLFKATNRQCTLNFMLNFGGVLK